MPVIAPSLPMHKLSKYKIITVIFENISLIIYNFLCIKRKLNNFQFVWKVYGMRNFH